MGKQTCAGGRSSELRPLPPEDNTVAQSQSDKNAPQKSFRLKPPHTRHAVSVLICAVCMLCATLASFLYQHIVPDNHANVALIYILALMIIARWTVGYGYGIACSLFSVIAINYLFTYPYYKINFTLTGYPITFLLMGGITLILCTMTSHMTIQSEMIAEREKQLAEAEMEKMRANLLRAISHDLRTPLTGIIGNSSLFLESQEDLSSAEQRKIMTNIYEDSNWLLNMVENLLSVTRIQGDSLSINTTEEPVEEVVAEALEKLRKRYPDAAIHVKIPDEFLMIPMDAVLIEQVTINLLENAIVHAESILPIDFIVEDHADHVSFIIRDYGKGLSEEKLQNLFDITSYSGSSSQSSDSRKGMGIGLSICKTIITAHHGTLSGKNHEDGAEFCFTLPKTKNMVVQ